MPTPSHIDHDTLREIVNGTAGEIGEEFFDMLVQHLARAMGTTCAWITEWIEDDRRLRALSFWAEDRHVSDYEYYVAGTPCEPVIQKREFFHVPDRLIELFPKDPDLSPLGAVSYMGVPLLDTDGHLLGHLAILHNKPLPPDPKISAIFNIFAGRAGAELRRLRRDRELREREQKMSRLIESAKDSIIELNAALSVTRLNRAAEQAFGIKDQDAKCRGFDDFLTEQSYKNLTSLITKLSQRSEGERSMWITEGIEAKTSTEETFPAEASISSFDHNGQTFYTVILRNTNEILQAQQEILSLRDETAYLRTQIEDLSGSNEIVGHSRPLRRVIADVNRVAQNHTTVLITGETGTGKELIARAIHRQSPRASQSFIKVNCAAIAANLQESEFFGHERGAFTGATQHRVGRFKLANSGSIFLDEVGEMPLDLQSKLLRVLQEGEYEPVGSSRTEKVNVRIIAATNQDLDKMVKEGTFRRDLLYRLNVFPLHIPPLRERGDDIVHLAEAFLLRYGKRNRRSAFRLTEECRVKLKGYDWPGNIRELENVIERAVITSKDGRTLNLDWALPNHTPVIHESIGMPQRQDDSSRVLTATEMRDLERSNILRALEGSNWKISGRHGAAEKLGLNPNTLTSRMQSLGIQKPH